MEVAQGEMDDFNQVLADAFIKMGTTVPVVRLSAEELEAIRSLLHQLLNDWAELQTGQTMILEF